MKRKKILHVPGQYGTCTVYSPQELKLIPFMFFYIVCQSRKVLWRFRVFIIVLAFSIIS